MIQGALRPTVQRDVPIRPLMQSAVAGLTAQSDALDQAAAAVTHAGAELSAGGSAAFQISAAARDANQSQEHKERALTSGLEGAMVDTRIAKYAYIANLKVLQTAAEVEKAAADLLKPKQ